MIVKRDKKESRTVRHLRIRKNLVGTASRPRLCVFRSNRNISAQIIDDTKNPITLKNGRVVVSGVTLVSASTYEKDAVKGSNIEAAKYVGKLIAERALQANITEVVFDRGGFLFHGKVKALADAAREAGLKF